MQQEAEEEIDKRDRAGESHLERWASTLLGEFDFDSAAGREALNALVEYAREKEREAREQARQLAEAEAQIEDLEAQLKDAPESPTGVQAILELEEMVEILEAENKELQESNDARARALRDALDALPGLDSLRRGREAARRRIGRHASTHDGP